MSIEERLYNDGKALEARVAELEAALRAMTTNRIHDALCQVFAAWENEHSDFDRARLVLGDIKVQVSPEDVAAGPIKPKD